MKIGNIAIGAAYLGEKVLTAIAVGATKVWEVSKYIKFKDPVVEQLCMKWSSDGIGLTPKDAAKVTDIETTFRGNKKITSFDELKKFGVTSLSPEAFRDCTGLTSVTIPNSVTSIGRSAFDYCTGLTSVTIGNSVTSIGADAFENCSGLTSVTIPNSVTSIGSWAFYGCSGLTSVTIGNSVKSIGDSAFHNCTGLTSVTIPNSVTSIEMYAFNGAQNLNYIICRPTTPPKLGAAVYSNNCPVYVPDESVNAYKKATNWAKLGDRIKPLSEFVEPTNE